MHGNEQGNFLDGRKCFYQVFSVCSWLKGRVNTIVRVNVVFMYLEKTYESVNIKVFGEY